MDVSDATIDRAIEHLKMHGCGYGLLGGGINRAINFLSKHKGKIKKGVDMVKGSGRRRKTSGHGRKRSHRRRGHGLTGVRA